MNDYDQREQQVDTQNIAGRDVVINPRGPILTRRQLLVGGAIVVLGTVGAAWLLSSHSSNSSPPTPTPTSTPYTGKPTNSSDPFYVYDHYDPRGFMGDIGDITKEEQPNDRLVRFIYDAQGRGPHEWDLKYIGGQLNPSPSKFAGIMFLDGDWGKDSGAGFDLRGRPVIKWEARSLNGPVWVQFGAGGVTWVWDDVAKKRVDLPHPDSMPSIKLGGQSPLTGEWQAFNPRLSLSDDALRAVIGAFWWIIKWDSNGVQVEQPKTFIIEVRNISYGRA